MRFREFFSRSIPSALVALLITSTPALAASSNRNEVRANLERDGWSIAWGVTLNEAEYAKFIAAIGLSATCECITPIETYFNSLADRTVSKITTQLPGVAKQEVVEFIVKAFQGSQRERILVGNGFQISAGIATYRRWNDVIYDEPRTYRCKQSLPFGGWTWSVCTTMERVKKTVSLPNHHQPYVKFRFDGRVVSTQRRKPGASSIRVGQMNEQAIAYVRRTPPRLISPTDNSLVRKNHTTLSWSPVRGAVGYYIEAYFLPVSLDKNNRVSIRLFNTDKKLNSNQKQISLGELTEGKSLSNVVAILWRVRAIAPDGEAGAKSQMGGFRYEHGLKNTQILAEKYPQGRQQFTRDVEKRMRDYDFLMNIP